MAPPEPTSRIRLLRPAMSATGAVLREYLDHLFKAFDRAAEREASPLDLRCRIAGRTLRIRAAGSALAASIPPALAHLPGSEATPDLDVVAWDETETGVPLPPRPWIAPENPTAGRLAVRGGTDGFRIAGVTRAEGIHLFDPDSGRGAWILPDARQLPNHQHAAPLLTILKWWAPEVGLRLLHAGCVGNPAGAVLLAGRGGSGKSTTSLLCALEGLDYLSDDYCLTSLGEAPTAFSLYSTGKLHRDHLSRFPELLSRSADPRPDPGEKPIIFLHRHFPESVVLSRPIVAVLAPTVTGKPESSLEPVSPADGLRALAPSTLLQLTPDDASGFSELGRLVRRVPSFRLNLGTRTEEIAPAIRDLLLRLP